MAIIECPECKKEISDKANVCVHCGFPIKEYLENNAEKEEKENIEEEKQKEQYWCRNCHRQNKIGEDYCTFCGNRLTPYYKPMDSMFSNWDKEEITSIDTVENREVKNTEKPHEFHGIYRYTLLGGKQEVYCPRCHSENCSHYKEQKIIPEKTKTRYSVNLNPLKPFTFAPFLDLMYSTSSALKILVCFSGQSAIFSNRSTRTKSIPTFIINSLF